MKKLTEKQLLDRADKVISKLRQDLNDDDIPVKYQIGPRRDQIGGKFYQYIRLVKKTYIEMLLCHPDYYKKYPLLSWDADLKITYLHEYGHYWESRSLSKKQRIEDEKKYHKSNRYQGEAEEYAWDLAIYFTKKLRLHRNQHIRKAYKEIGMEVDWKKKRKLNVRI